MDLVIVLFVVLLYYFLFDQIWCVCFKCYPACTFKYANPTFLNSSFGAVRILPNHAVGFEGASSWSSAHGLHDDQ